MNIMSHPFSFSDTRLSNNVGSTAVLARLVGNLRGFAYRRRHDARWTMDFISDGCRDVTGYDPHRFIANASLAFGDLIVRADWPRVNEKVEFAVQQRKPVAIEYLIRAAHGALVRVEDRLTPVISATGEVLAIEGIIDHARPTQAAAHPAFSNGGQAGVPPPPFHSSN